MRGARGTNKEAVYTLRIDRAKLERLRLIAADEHRNVCQELRRMVDERIAAHDDQQAAA